MNTLVRKDNTLTLYIYIRYIRYPKPCAKLVLPSVYSESKSQLLCFSVFQLRLKELDIIVDNYR